MTPVPSLCSFRGIMLITGASGFIGSRLATLALAQGWAVRTLTRNDWAGTPAVPIEQRHLGSLPSQIPVGALTGADVVVHCAATVDVGERSAWAVNVEGTVRLAALARQVGVRTFIFLSSQAARPDAHSVYGRTKYTAERRLFAQEGLLVIVLRPGLVTGPGKRGLFRRLNDMVDALPIVPLLGGGHSIVQPLHVDELCTAILRCAEHPLKFDRAVLSVGHPEGLRLADFLQHIAVARAGRQKATLAIPLRPVEFAVALAERLRIPLPITSNNLRGMRIIQRMDTADDLARLGLELRPVAEMVRVVEPDPKQSIPLKDRAVQVLLVGAGRVGLVHAVTISRARGAVLSGVVDPNNRATRLLRGMGLSGPMFRNLNDALTQTTPDAIVIATPGATHLALTQRALRHGLAAMVEKPLAVRREQLPDYERMAKEFPNRPVQVGYVLPRNPHVAYYLDQLRGGGLGKIQGFVGLTLLSLIQGPTKRWETNRAISGGGVLINCGGHVLSMIRAALGDPEDVRAEHLHLHSGEVEDSIVLTLEYPNFCGRHYCSWSIDGYPRQENLLTIWTDRGRLILTGSVGVFLHTDGEVEVKHQLDFDVGFNMAPDYSGAGFTQELTDLQMAIRGGELAPSNLAEAIRLERVMFHAYEVSREVKRFSAEPLVSATPDQLPSQITGARLLSVIPRGIQRVLDLRDSSPAAASAFLTNMPSEGSWDEYLLVPTQLRGIRFHSSGARLRVTVPDFLNQSRLLLTGQHRKVLAQLGLSGILSAVRMATPLLATERAPTFWVAAMGLLAAGVQAVPPRFEGTLLIHVYLTDLALSLRRIDILERLITACRRLRPRARVGFHTNLAAEALNALALVDARIDDVSILTSVDAPNLTDLFSAMRQVNPSGDFRLTAEVGPAPAIIHRLAFEAPHRWALGADSLLIGSAADGGLARQRRTELDRAWARAFPGLELPRDLSC